MPSFSFFNAGVPKSDMKPDGLGLFLDARGLSNRGNLCPGSHGKLEQKQIHQTDEHIQIRPKSFF